MPGKKPASAEAQGQAQDDRTICGPRTKTMQVEMMPQVIMMRRHPESRAKLFHDEVAGDFEEEVSDEEDAGAQAVDGVVEVQVLLHLELGEGNVDAVEVVHEVEEDHERDESEHDLGDDVLARRIRRW